jgi:hypothetical protein
VNVRRLVLDVTLYVAALLPVVCCAGAENARAQANEVEATNPLQRVDGLAAVVGGLAPGPSVISILRSDVELRARMALLRDGTLAQALAPLAEGLLQASAVELLGEALIAVEAQRLGVERPRPEALAAERARFLGARARAVETSELLKALGVTERELATIVERRALVSAFMDANLEGTLDVSAAELERQFTSEPHPFTDLPFEQARASFSAWLTGQRMERAVRTWVESLRQRTPHRLLVSY